MDGAPALEFNNLNEDCSNISCQQCDRTFSSERSLRCHVKVHNDKVLNCCFCEQMFNRTDTLFLHALDHLTKSVIPCQAEGCGVEVNSMSEGELHANSHHNVHGMPMMKCKECPEYLTSFRKMLYHHTFKHGALKPYADEMTAKQKEFLRIKKNQSRINKKLPNEIFLDNKVEIGVADMSGSRDTNRAKTDNDEVLEINNSGDNILKQLQIAMANTTESNTNAISKLSDIVSELFPLSLGDQYQCFHCMLGFTDAILWLTHLSYHDVQQPFKCSSCRRNFENSQTFVLHLTYFAHGANSKCNN